VEERVEKVPLSLRADCSVEHLPHNATQMLLDKTLRFWMIVIAVYFMGRERYVREGNCFSLHFLPLCRPANQQSEVRAVLVY